MIVVADTSPLNYLILIGQQALLPTLFAKVLTTPAVMRELAHHRAPRAVREWAANPGPWLEVVVVDVIALPPELDAGEREAISLALLMKAETLLIDERLGTTAARSLGLRPLGTIGVLEEAASKDLVSLPHVMALLKATSFRVAPALIDAALDRDSRRRQE